MLPPVGSRSLVGDPLIELLGVRGGGRALASRRILLVFVRRAGMRWRWGSTPARHGRRDRLLRLFHVVLVLRQPPTPCRFSQRSHAAMTMCAIAWRSFGSLTNSGIVNAATVPSSRTNGTVRRPVSRSNSNEPYDQCSVSGTALTASVTTLPYPAAASRNRRRHIEPHERTGRQALSASPHGSLAKARRPLPLRHSEAPRGVQTARAGPENGALQSEPATLRTSPGRGACWFRQREEGQWDREMTALDDTLLEKVKRLVDVSREPLRWTSSTTVVIAQLVERIEALEAALREIADAVSAAEATEADYAATERRSSDHLSESMS
jgi:hypothetical protein